MGQIREDVGRFSIEERRESFHIHYDPKDDTLKRFWGAVPHPEFDKDDLADLIKALTEFKKDLDENKGAYKHG